MRVWLDLITPKQVLFFAPLVAELTKSGTTVFVTSRRYREVSPLAERAGLEVDYVGERGEKGPVDQLLAATKRQEELIPKVRGFAPDVAVSVASAVCARIAFGLGVNHVAVNDSPHSEIAGRLSIPLSRRLACPWIIPYRAWAPYGIPRDRVTTYHALDPAVWLKRPPLSGPVPPLDKSKKTITVRIQESDAPYLAGADADWVDRVLESLLKLFPEANLVALCRYGYQVDEIRSRFGSRWIVPDEVVSGRGLLDSTDLFIGMGGTMSAEAALMGVPTISVYQGSLYTDRYLQAKGLLARARTPASLASLAKRFVSDAFRQESSRRARRVLASMEDPVPRVAQLIRKTANQA